MRCKGSRIVSGSSDGMVKLWDMESGELVKELTTSDAVWKVGFLKEEILAVFSQSNRVTLGVSRTTGPFTTFKLQFLLLWHTC
jgi:WD40 repeat protein